MKSGIRIFFAVLGFPLFADDSGKVVVSESPDGKFGVAGTSSVAMRFELRLKEDGTWEILDQDKVAESEVLGD